MHRLESLSVFFFSPSILSRVICRTMAGLRHANYGRVFRVTGVYVSLMVAYRATLLLSRILSCFVFTDLGEISSSASTTTTSVLIIFDPLEIIISTIQTVTLVAFLVDWRLRCVRWVCPSSRLPDVRWLLLRGSGFSPATFR